jgi:hypothetical protein
MFSSKTALIVATSAAIALTGFDLRPAAAAPEGGPAIVKQGSGADEFSSQRKRRRGRGVHPGVPLAAFGALIGTIGAVAAANRQREYYYGGPTYYYAEPQYVPPPNVYYQPAPAYQHHAPYAYQHHAPAPRHYGGPGFRHGHTGAPPASNPAAASPPNDGRL